MKTCYVNSPYTRHRNTWSSSLWVKVPWADRRVTACPHCTSHFKFQPPTPPQPKTHLCILVYTITLLMEWTEKHSWVQDTGTMHTADLMTASLKPRFHATDSSFPQTHKCTKKKKEECEGYKHFKTNREKKIISVVSVNRKLSLLCPQ